MRPLTRDPFARATFTLDCEPEHVTIEGNASAIDEETDAAACAWIRDQLDRGNPWAWCCAKVTARLDGFEGTAYLGCCSYESESAFRKDGYFEEMKAEALDNLKASVADAKASADAILSE